MDKATLAMRCPNDSCNCKAGCNCGTKCQCGSKPIEKMRCTNNNCEHKSMCKCEGGRCKCGSATERAPRACGNPKCTCGTNCTCGPTCQCGTKHGEKQASSTKKGEQAKMPGESQGKTQAEKIK
ncbi:Copper-inducible metallothionein CuMT1 [Balamuthia mandrillaris]